LGIEQYKNDYDGRYMMLDDGGGTGVPADVPIASRPIDNPFGPHRRVMQGWNHFVQPYVKSAQLFRCPSAATPPNADASVNISNKEQTGHSQYAMNTRVNGGWGYTNANWGWGDGPIAESKMEFPTMTILVADSLFVGSAGPQTGPGDPTENPANDLADSWNYGSNHVVGKRKGGALTRHLEGANYLFADGHVKWYSAASMPMSRILKRDGTEPTYEYQR
jgi:prepilin-type processing-associated H-X9-DG protein